jgi:hypothetical protein
MQDGKLNELISREALGFISKNKSDLIDFNEFVDHLMRFAEINK